MKGHFFIRPPFWSWTQHMIYTFHCSYRRNFLQGGVTLLYDMFEQKAIHGVSHTTSGNICSTYSHRKNVPICFKPFSFLVITGCDNRNLGVRRCGWNSNFSAALVELRSFLRISSGNLQTPASDPRHPQHPSLDPDTLTVHIAPRRRCPIMQK